MCGSLIFATCLSYMLQTAPASEEGVSSTAPPTVESVLGSSGAAYVRARTRLLSMDPGEVEKMLRSRRESSDDVITQLCLDAITLRLKDPTRLDTALREAFAIASSDNSHLKRNPYAGSDPPRPNEASWHLISVLGDDVVPFAAELVVKELTTDWPEWQRLVPVYALQFMGRRRLPNHDYSDVHDARAGTVLLWCAEHAQQDRDAAVAARALWAFPSQRLLELARAAAQRRRTEARQEILRTALRTLETAERLETNRARARTTQPASGPGYK